MMWTAVTPRLAATLTLVFTVSATACAHVGQEDENAGFRGERVRAVSYGEAPERLVFPDQAGHDKGIENRRVALVVERLGMTMDFRITSETR